MTAEITDLSNLFSLKDKVAIVTGGGGILGLHFCAGLAQFGAKVIVADVSLEAAKGTAKKVKDRFGIDTVPKNLDVASEKSVNEIVDFAVSEFGSVDILHNNAATKSSDLKRFFGDLENYDMDIWREVMDVNLHGMFVMARTVGAQMFKQESGGSIIQTSSIYGILAPDQRIYEGSEYMGMPINNPAVYSASKAGVIGLTKHLSTHWLNSKIRVNALTPGGVESGQNDVFQKNYSNRVPMGRMAQASEIVGALLFLASDASTYITGQNIVVDGGLSAW